MTMLKCMHTLLIEYAMPANLKTHKGTRSGTFIQTVTREWMQVNITVIAIFVFPTYVKITPIHTIRCANHNVYVYIKDMKQPCLNATVMQKSLSE